ncbi:hypothetical protein X801_08329 [Opisthorchis viverrini]|uniref:Uncharacterized protein n=1 Tax=Opisthorchis viverrini TaxID=6198 RepID=A0A1S8WNB1_OPIVI|nr:hypothetical protein X801_08329 [Opisthorchis viverrini]
MTAAVTLLIVQGNRRSKRGRESSGSRLKTPPYLHTIENCMHLVPMLIQAVPPCASPLLQLPHLTQTQLRHMEAKQPNP